MKSETLDQLATLEYTWKGDYVCLLAVMLPSQQDSALVAIERS